MGWHRWEVTSYDKSSRRHDEDVRQMCRGPYVQTPTSLDNTHFYFGLSPTSSLQMECNIVGLNPMICLAKHC